MPMPKPTGDETRDAFISRFMSSDAMEEEYPDRKQRAAVAYSTWRDARGKTNIVMNAASEFCDVRMKTNLDGLVRYDELDGRRRIVVPVVMINEGVHHGSGGRVYYPPTELRSSAESWNHKPVMLGHPMRDGAPVTACSKDALDNERIGILMNTEWLDDIRALRSEAWLDVEKLSRLDSSIEEKLNKLEVLEVSTGLYTDDVVESGLFENEEFERMAFNHRPDHLALLVDAVGACSVRDGAGMPRLNKDMDPMRWIKDNAPSEVATFVENAVRGADDSNKDFETNKGADKMDREKMIAELVANDLYKWSKDDEKFLTELDDDTLAKLAVNETEETNEDDGNPVQTEPGKPVDNEKPAGEAPKTLEQFVAEAPDGDVKETLTYAVNELKSKKRNLVDGIAANKRCKFNKSELEAKSVDELEKINEMIAEPEADYSGQASQPRPTANVSVEPLPDPWAAEDNK